MSGIKRSTTLTAPPAIGLNFKQQPNNNNRIKPIIPMINKTNNPGRISLGMPVASPLNTIQEENETNNNVNNNVNNNANNNENNNVNSGASTPPLYDHSMDFPYGTNQPASQSPLGPRRGAVEFISYKNPNGTIQQISNAAIAAAATTANAAAAGQGGKRKRSTRRTLRKTHKMKKTRRNKNKRKTRRY